MSVISITVTPAGAGYPGPDQPEGTPSVLGDFGIGLPATAGTSSVVYFTIIRTGELTQFQSVDWAVTGSGANPAGSDDFVGGFAPSGTVTFGPGDSEIVIRVDIQADFRPENTEQFSVLLFNPTNGATLSGVSSASATIVTDDPFVIGNIGTTGNDKIDDSATTTTQRIDVSQGGNDTVTGGSADDIFYFGGAFTNADTVKGGAGSDTLVLDGDYGAGISFGSKTISAVENIYLNAGNNYNLTFNKSNVASSDLLRIDASAVGVLNSTTVSGAAVSGRIHFLGGAGVNTFTGGKGADMLIGGISSDGLVGGDGNDIFNGGYGPDSMNGGKGADTFIYDDRLDSPLLISSGTIDISGADSLVSFSAKDDKIDLSAFDFAPGAATVLNKTAVGYTSNASAGTGFFGSSAVAVEYAAKSTKSSDARIYVDANRDGNLNAGDLLIQATQVGNGAMKSSNFIF